MVQTHSKNAQQNVDNQNSSNTSKDDVLGPSLIFSQQLTPHEQTFELLLQEIYPKYLDIKPSQGPLEDVGNYQYLEEPSMNPNLINP